MNIRHNQARINREAFTADQPCGNAGFNNALENWRNTKPAGDWLIGLGCLLSTVVPVVIGIAATTVAGKKSV